MKIQFNIMEQNQCNPAWIYLDLQFFIKSKNMINKLYYILVYI